MSVSVTVFVPHMLRNCLILELQGVYGSERIFGTLDQDES